MQKANKLWYNEIKALDSEATKREYSRYNNNFIKWHICKYGRHSFVEEGQVREYI